MTIYEQIQKAIDCIEEDLGGLRHREDVARQAGMSVRSFQHYFWAVTGMTYQEYVVGRRLSEASLRLASTPQSILQVALDCGYQSHEAFTRAFKDQFGVTPRQFRQGRPTLITVGKIRTYKELIMGVILKDLPELRCAVFDGYGTDPENQAHRLLDQWKAGRREASPARILGHNLTGEGAMAFGPDHSGYRLLHTLAQGEDPRGAAVHTVPAGRFAVTGIEGNFTDDPQGRWIGAGWARMNTMAAQKGLKSKAGARWFEEELEPQTVGNLRLDLYLEVGE